MQSAASAISTPESSRASSKGAFRKRRPSVPSRQRCARSLPQGARVDARLRSPLRSHVHWRADRPRRLPRQQAMLRSTAFVLIFCAHTASAQQAGSQIRATPQVPQPQNPASTEASSAPTTRTIKCEWMSGEARDRCLREQRDPDIEKKPVGAGSTGMGSGAGGGSSGPGGSAGLGGGAPR